MKKNSFHLLFSFFIVGIIVISQIECTNPPGSYYVSESGNDNNPGTRDRPFKTIAKVNGIKLESGGAVFFKGGETFDGTLSLTIKGTNDKPVTISSYGEGIATINGGNDTAIAIRGIHFKLSTINAKGSGRKSGNTTHGISLVESSYGTVENVKTEGFQKSGLDLYDCKNIQIKNVYATENGFCGINIGGSKRNKSKNILVQNCKSENNPGDPTNSDNHSGNGILVGQSDSVTIDHCTATKNGWDMPRIGNGPVGIWAYESDHVTIQYCISYRNKTSIGGKDGGGFDLDGGVTNSIIQYCLSYENEGAGYGLFQYAGASLWYNNVVRYCISINDATTTEGSGGIFMWNNSEDSVQLADCIVHNNLVYSTHAPAIQFEQSSKNKNFTFYNNIFIGAGQIINGPTSGERFIGNTWWKANNEITFRGYKNLAEWSDATGQEKFNGETIGKQIDPLLAGPFTTILTDPYKLNSLTGYTLQPGSPLKNAGLNLKTFFNIPFAPHDFFGNPVPLGNNPEAGVYEMSDE